jgi:hypothetical protein
LDTTVSSRSSSTEVSGFRTTLNNTGAVQAGNGYRARLFITNNRGIATAPSATPTITIYDANRSTIISGASMTNIGTGLYEYTYSVATNAAQGTWETVVSTNLDGSNTKTDNAYWLVAGSPAQVIINSVTTDSATTTNNAVANLTVTNEGLTGYEYQYEWCVVSSEFNNCGGGDDEYRGTGAKFINPGEDWNTDLTATVSRSGNYYFKVVVYFGTERSGSSRTFSITVPGSSNNNSSGGSRGGGGGGGSTRTDTNTARATDFNGDSVVNSTDFSILLYFWKAKPPFTNAGVDINKDNKVDSIDFSILLYQWGRNTGR